MAQKNFFVDINLQGNKLANSTVGANSSMTVGGSFQYAEGRLEYFDGATVQEVANLSDITAITGGLIFQGGYDSTTNTPDITDGTALKGFFWAATNAGSFLGESVQVGDSIIAKVDNAGATINDWLILQGNVVIATDTVDGISRLATQAEADAGTEGGAVVITPATLQGKIDAQITPEISSKLPLAGGTMSGAIDMGGNSIAQANFVNANQVNADVIESLSSGTVIFNSNINMQSNELANVNLTDVTNITMGGGNINMGGQVILDASLITGLAAPTADGDAANKLYVDGAASTAESNANAYTDAVGAEKLDLAGGTMTGAINMGNNNITNGNSISANTLQATGDTIVLANDLDAVQSSRIKNLPAPIDDLDAARKEYVDGQVATALPLAGGTMSGAIDMDSYSLQNANLANGQLISNFNANNYTINGLATPTDGGDAANKTYVDGAASTAQANAEATASADATTKANAAQANAEAYADGLAVNYDAAGSAATAEANANSYTDAEIAAQSFTIALETGAWSLNGSDYEAIVTHNLNSTYPVVAFIDNATGKSAELIYEPTGTNTILVSSNILPASIQVSLVAVR